MAVTLADCVPVFIGHPSGGAAILHSGWRGTAGGIIAAAIRFLGARGLRPADLYVHCGPSICGGCYEVSPDVFQALTGRPVEEPTPVDLRELILSRAAAAGVKQLSSSSSCTRCNNDRFFSHRCGDHGRQLGIIVSRS
jgi:copper oxidase (laccase) domain-containing protein